MPEFSVKSFFEEIKSTPSILQNSYYPSLNGLRGVAIILVVFAHLGLNSGDLYGTIFNGELGVLIFFVLSGFLITTLCIREKLGSGDISLKMFYIRRALRIFPVAYLYLLVIVILNAIFKLDIHFINILGSALYITDFSSYFRKHYFSWHTGHYWSLSVEEQFYLLVPFVLKKQFQLYLLLLLFMVFILPVIIVLQNFYPALNGIVLYTLTHFLIKFQAIAVGCLFSVLMFKYPISKNLSVYFKVISNLTAFFIIIIIRYDNFFSVQSVFSSLLIAFLIGYIIITNLIQTNDFIFKLLNAKWLTTIGVLSYSIYIWQQVFTSNDKRLPYFMVTAPYNILCIIAVSCLSYYFYESFFLRLKTKFNTLKTIPK